MPGFPSTRPAPVPPTLELPGFGNPNRPGINYPNIGNIINNRPIIGGPGSNIGNITNINNININQNIINPWNLYTHRPPWDFDPGFSRPGWGIGGNYWYDRWHYNCVRPRWHWYHGCWHGYWGSSWYVPAAWFVAGWGLGPFTNNWGFPRTYYNPYYNRPVVVQTVPHDYSQPIVVNNYVTTDSQGAPMRVESNSQEEKAFSVFEEGLERFAQGNYVQSLTYFKVAVKELPNDAIVHEVLCLNFFAVSDYEAAAAGLNSLLSSAPGMNWTTMIGLYGVPDDYTKQLRALESFVVSNPNNAAANFVLAYHYLVLGEKDSAVAALRLVLKNEPRDGTAQRMLDALASPEPSSDGAQPNASEPPISTGESLQTDLVGKWLAESGDVQIKLIVQEDFQFEWRVDAADQTPTQLTGNLSGDSDGLQFTTAGQGTLAGLAISQGPDHWIFKISGAPPSDPGLSFARIK